MDERAPNDVTHLLRAWSEGDQQALEKLTPLVYRELYRRAHWHMAREHPGHTLQTTALVNEIYVRLVDVQGVSWRDRAHFFAMSLPFAQNAARGDLNDANSSILIPRRRTTTIRRHS